MKPLPPTPFPTPPAGVRYLRAADAGLPRAIFMPVVLPILLIGGGTLGYRIIEGWGWFDCLYMAVITLTTIGFGEVHPLSPAGRWFTMALALGGIFTIFFAATEVLRPWASGHLQELFVQRNLRRRVEQLERHVIICGFGRMGRMVAEELARAGVPFVAVESRVERLEDFGLPGGLALHGDATSDELLLKAGLLRARALVAALGSDADNLFITMSARLLADKVPIIARADDDASSAKLTRAGATRVIAPYVIGGTRVAQAILRPSVLDFVDLATRTEHIELQLEEVAVTAASSLAGRSLDDCGLRTRLDVIVVALHQAGRPTLFNPPGDVVLRAGDTVVMLGHRGQLDEVERLARGS